jgi:hypothetical protein
MVARDRRIVPPGKRFEDSCYRPAHLIFMPISIHPVAGQACPVDRTAPAVPIMYECKKDTLIEKRE